MLRSASQTLDFFFQAEAGIRDLIVTGVQTCALPISRADRDRGTPRRDAHPMAEVAEPLVVEPLVAVALEQRPNGGDEPIAWNEIGIQRPQPRAEHTAAYEQAVLVQRATDEGEIGGVEPAAARWGPR